MYYHGRGVPQSFEEAVKRFRQAAEQGHSESQYLMGMAYELGQGIARSEEDAIKWHRKAAAQDNYKSQERLERLFKKQRVQEK